VTRSLRFSKVDLVKGVYVCFRIVLANDICVIASDSSVAAESVEMDEDSFWQFALLYFVVMDLITFVVEARERWVFLLKNLYWRRLILLRSKDFLIKFHSLFLGDSCKVIIGIFNVLRLLCFHYIVYSLYQNAFHHIIEPIAKIVLHKLFVFLQS
jgi:hypothetical protein